MENLTTSIPYSVIKRIKEDPHLLEVYHLQKGYKPTLYVVLSKDLNDNLYYEIIAYGQQDIWNYLQEIADNDTILRKILSQIANVMEQFLRENFDEDIAKLKVGKKLLDTRTISEAELVSELLKMLEERD